MGGEGGEGWGGEEEEEEEGETDRGRHGLFVALFVWK